MPASNKALVLAKKAATTGGSKALELAKQAAGSKSVKTTSNKQADAIVTAVAGSVTTGGTAALTRRLAKRKNRRLAVDLARQIGGTYSTAIIAGDRYWVVWQEETPFDVFPALPEGSEPLAERRELQNYQGTRMNPSADSS
jgi:hypothetical protein